MLEPLLLTTVPVSTFLGDSLLSSDGWVFSVASRLHKLKK